MHLLLTINIKHILISTENEEGNPLSDAEKQEKKEEG